MTTELSRHAAAFDVGGSLDGAPLAARRIAVIALAALCVFVDGFDNQALGLAVPLLAAEWGLPSQSFAGVLAAGLIAVSVGTLVGGVLADRIGRRPVLIAGVVTFGSFSVAMAAATELSTLAALRVLASIGLGAVMPVAAALVAEIAPPRVRAAVVAATILSFPLGGSALGLLGPALVGASGWRALFVVGGIAAVALAFAVAALVPESPRFLVRHERRWPEARRALATLGIEAGPAPLIDSTEAPKLRVSPLVLFGSELRRTTVLLWIAAIAGLFALQLVTSWLPTMIATGTAGLAAAGRALSAYNFGGVLGAVAFSMATLRFGAARCAVAASLGGVATALLAARGVPAWPAIALHGMFAHATIVLLSALPLQCYPTSVRGTGSGAALTVGRSVAALGAPYAGAMLLGATGTPLLHAAAAAFAAVTVAMLALTSRPAIVQAAGRAAT